jgi:hypothetical protein
MVERCVPERDVGFPDAARQLVHYGMAERAIKPSAITHVFT